uniref:Acyl carrier protein n=1 Tax=uncultured bacterium contig00031 TaxID=1181520 RepID=A0A806KQC9_9BACT|nr:acyl carrier protein [uncultured bacterium contig00031]
MTTKDEIFQKLQEILAKEFEIEAESITPESQLYEDLELDSIDAVDLLVKMKQYVPGKIDPEQFKKVKTVQDIVDVLYTLIQKN